MTDIIFFVRYKTNIEDGEDTVIDKAIFGFNNKKTYEIVKKKLDDSLQRRLDFIMNSVKESESMVSRDKYQAAHDIIYVFYEEKCEGVNEFDKKYLDILEDSVKTLEEYVKQNQNDKRLEKFELAIWNGHDILDSSSRMILHNSLK